MHALHSPNLLQEHTHLLNYQRHLQQPFTAAMTDRIVAVMGLKLDDEVCCCRLQMLRTAISFQRRRRPRCRLASISEED